MLSRNTNKAFQPAMAMLVLGTRVVERIQTDILLLKICITSLILGFIICCIFISKDFLLYLMRKALESRENNNIWCYIYDVFHNWVQIQLGIGFINCRIFIIKDFPSYLMRMAFESREKYNICCYILTTNWTDTNCLTTEFL